MRRSLKMKLKRKLRKKKTFCLEKFSFIFFTKKFQVRKKSIGKKLICSQKTTQFSSSLFKKTKIIKISFNGS